MERQYVYIVFSSDNDDEVVDVFTNKQAAIDCVKEGIKVGFHRYFYDITLSDTYDVAEDYEIQREIEFGGE